MTITRLFLVPSLVLFQAVLLLFPSAAPAAAQDNAPVSPMLLAKAKPSSGLSPEKKGLDIARQVERRAKGYGDMQADMVMELSNPNGDQVTRHIRYKSIEVAGDGDKSLVLFDQPADIKGTALLTHGHKSGPDDQWLYLPAVKRVKRISSANKSGSFVGSEFAYEDLSGLEGEVEKFTYRWLSDKKCDQQQCYVIEAYPVDEKSGYTRQIQWIDKEELRVVVIEYYDLKNELLKTLKMKDYKKYLGQFWRAGTFEMVNHQNAKSTKLMWRNYRFRNGFTPADFSSQSLERAR
jgi:outer membrane lipoprotein-sorting protein